MESGENELGAAAFDIVIDLVEGAPDEVKAQAAGLNEIERTAAEPLGLRLKPVIAQAETDTPIDLLTSEADQLIGLMLVGVTDDVGAGLVEPEDHQVLVALRKADIAQKLAHKVAHEGKIR